MLTPLVSGLLPRVSSLAENLSQIAEPARGAQSRTQVRHFNDFARLERLIGGHTDNNRSSTLLVTGVSIQWVRFGVLREDLALEQMVPATVFSQAFWNR